MEISEQPLDMSLVLKILSVYMTLPHVMLQTSQNWLRAKKSMWNIPEDSFPRMSAFAINVYFWSIKNTVSLVVLLFQNCIPLIEIYVKILNFQMGYQIWWRVSGKLVGWYQNHHQNVLWCSNRNVCSAVCYIVSFKNIMTKSHNKHHRKLLVALMLPKNPCEICYSYSTVRHFLAGHKEVATA